MLLVTTSGQPQSASPTSRRLSKQPVQIQVQATASQRVFILATGSAFASKSARSSVGAFCTLRHFSAPKCSFQLLFLSPPLWHSRSQWVTLQPQRCASFLGKSIVFALRWAEPNHCFNCAVLPEKTQRPSLPSLSRRGLLELLLLDSGLCISGCIAELLSSTLPVALVARGDLLLGEPSLAKGIWLSLRCLPCLVQARRPSLFRRDKRLPSHLPRGLDSGVSPLRLGVWLSVSWLLCPCVKLCGRHVQPTLFVWSLGCCWTALLLLLQLLSWSRLCDRSAWDALSRRVKDC